MQPFQITEELANALVSTGDVVGSIDVLEAHAMFHPQSTTLTHINMLAQVRACTHVSSCLRVRTCVYVCVRVHVCVRCV